MNHIPVIREIHIGGGTPTFFSPKNLSRLLNVFTKNSIAQPLHEFMTSIILAIDINQVVTRRQLIFLQIGSIKVELKDSFSLIFYSP